MQQKKIKIILFQFLINLIKTKKIKYGGKNISNKII